MQFLRARGVLNPELLSTKLFESELGVVEVTNAFLVAYITIITGLYVANEKSRIVMNAIAGNIMTQPRLFAA